MNLGIIIQARMESQRLPGKSYAKILDKHLLEWVILRVKKNKLVKKIVVAIPDTEKSSVLLPLIKKNKVDFYQGSLDNVILRSVEAAEKFKIDPVVRITADCPLMDPVLIDNSVKEYKKFEKKPDYFFIDGYPRGSGDIEILTLSALKKSLQLTKDPYHLEGMVPFILKRPDLFNIKTADAIFNLRRPDLRVCVDEKVDLVLVRKIFNHFKPRKYFTTEEVIKYLDRNPKLVDINKNVRQKI